MSGEAREFAKCAELRTIAENVFATMLVKRSGDINGAKISETKWHLGAIGAPAFRTVLVLPKILVAA